MKQRHFEGGVFRNKKPSLKPRHFELVFFSKADLLILSQFSTAPRLCCYCVTGSSRKKTEEEREGEGEGQEAEVRNLPRRGAWRSCSQEGIMRLLKMAASPLRQRVSDEHGGTWVLSAPGAHLY